MFRIQVTRFNADGVDRDETQFASTRAEASSVFGVLKWSGDVVRVQVDEQHEGRWCGWLDTREGD